MLTTPEPRTSLNSLRSAKFWAASPSSVGSVSSSALPSRSTTTTRTFVRLANAVIAAEASGSIRPFRTESWALLAWTNASCTRPRVTFCSSWRWSEYPSGMASTPRTMSVIAR